MAEQLAAMVLGAGRGERLLPLTELLPKPMLPVAGKPILERAIDLLRRIDISTVGVNLHHLGETMIRHFRNAPVPGVQIEWRWETELTGPAGAVLCFADVFRNARAIIVLSGDVVSDIAIERFVEAHLSSGALLTVALTPTRNAGRYGVASLDPCGRIASFVEKPPVPPEEMRLVSAGMYCLDPKLLTSIPRGVVFDFGMHLIPQLARDGLEVRGYVHDGYWSDVGEPESLLRSNLDAVSGALVVDVPGEWDDRRGSWIHPTACIDANAVVSGPVYIGCAATLERGAQVLGPAVISPGARVGSGAVLHRSLLFPGALAAPGQVYVNAIIASAEATVEERCARC